MAATVAVNRRCYARADAEGQRADPGAWPITDLAIGDGLPADNVIKHDWAAGAEGLAPRSSPLSRIVQKVAGELMRPADIFTHHSEIQE